LGGNLRLSTSCETEALLPTARTDPEAGSIGTVGATLLLPLLLQVRILVLQLLRDSFKSFNDIALLSYDQQTASSWAILPRPQQLLVLVVLILRSVAVGSVHEQVAKTKGGRKTKEFGTSTKK